MKPILRKDTPSFDVFTTKFNAWCVEKSFNDEATILKVMPSCVDDELLAPIVNIFSLGTTTRTSAFKALKAEYLRQSKPADADTDFNRIETALPSQALDTCMKLTKLAGYLHLNDDAVKHRLFKSLPSSIQASVVPWLSANDKASSRELAIFVTTFPDTLVQMAQTTAVAATVTPRPTCSHCKKVGHSKDRCFKLRTCWTCKKSGHIAKFCQEPKNE